MTVYFVSRHQGAKDWVQQQGIDIDQMIEHIDLSIIKQGDIIIGTLPVHLAAEIQDKGGRYIHLRLDLSAELRGKELTAEDMIKAGATLAEYQIKYINNLIK